MGLGVLAVLHGSYGKVTLGRLGRAMKQPLRQPIGLLGQVVHMAKARHLYTPTLDGGTLIKRTQLQDRGRPRL